MAKVKKRTPSEEALHAERLAHFDAALAELGWSLAQFCRATGLHRNTPSRWRNAPDGVMPEWVGKHLALVLEVQRLHHTYVDTPEG